MHTAPVRMAIFASGGGSNARNLLNHFQGSDLAEVCLMVSNNSQSGIFQFGPDFQVPTMLLTRSEYSSGTHLRDLMQAHQVDLIILAGYLKLIPAELVAAFPDTIINIHPALLPRYGGKGMYGMNVHKAVIQQGEAWSGITIHRVNEEYDKGAMLFQHGFPVEADWAPEDLAKRIQKAEHRFFPQVVESVCKTLNSQD
ncbi:phosphoribosylglycinamide formyltransferase [Pontibacter sp. G13]|uniref:phosphoribosylglycinamide formyltransferase n=1 Tax=Pontibacter sp. G13 TaxID=3074898 RepID=UPI00288B5A7A|nr:phosphoribosylglycinamide formyltransferase [Pontibacter sp. G13]WNJ16707.1 phosphoribosylglycinamide formyltransferase [Pontibacter sp. G13]